jgi:diguanylate cyclase (GGDEF)-like protein
MKALSRTARVYIICVSLRDLIKETALRGGYLSSLMIDIDNFKQFNDTYGHVAGDQLLTLIARLLRQNLRQQDIACRYGGDELAVLLVNADKARAIDIGERIYQVIRSYPFQVRHQKKGLSRFDISASIGISTYPEVAGSREALIEGADEACYRAKRLGGGIAYHVPLRDVASRVRTRVSIVK